MNDLIRESVDRARAEGSGYGYAILADKLVAQLEEQEPETLDLWLHAHARALVAREMSAYGRAVTAKILSGRSAAAFGVAARAYAEDADPKALSEFYDLAYAVDDENTQRPVAYMNGIDPELYFSGAKEELSQCVWGETLHDGNDE